MINFDSLKYPERLFIKGVRANAMSLYEAYCDMEVTYVENKKIVDKIRTGNHKMLNVLKGLILKNGDRLIQPEYIDYYFGWRFNQND